MAKFEFGFDESWFRLIIKKLPENQELFIPKEVENAQRILRIGKLKVGAARVWAETADLIKKKNKTYGLTPLGRLISRFDPDMEEDGIWWAIHCHLARSTSPAWFYSFYINFFEHDSFDRQLLESEMRAFWAKDHKPLTDDMFNKLVFSPLKQVFDGTRLGDGFGLFYETAPGAYERRHGAGSALHPAIVAYSLCDWAKKNKRQTAHIEELLSPGGPGRILRLDRATLDEMLIDIGDRYMKKVAWISHTANLNSVAILDVPPLAILAAYYFELDQIAPPNALEKAMEMTRSREIGEWK